MDPTYWERVDYSMFNSEENIEKLMSIMRMVEEKNNLTGDEFADVLKEIEKNQKWLEKNLKDVEAWLDTEILKMINT